MRKSSRIAFIAGLILLASAIAAVYYNFDPADTRWLPRCLFHEFSGLKCPGCGAQTAAHALVHGDFAGAWRANPFLMFIVPLFPLMLWLELASESRPRIYARFYSRPVAFAICASVILWALLRNLLGI